ncbi:hypothetical protein GCM10022378_15750 [Salinicoccus jeotgali]|uniref:Homing endonuclease LAGLIDADG domain-containing protein n=1 Tax=Salinicoccus jeotgali TaxID=381634 RepID=A0ABP7F1G4_9STAP
MNNEYNERCNNIISINYRDYLMSKEWRNKICLDELIGFVSINRDGGDDVRFEVRKNYKTAFVKIEDHDRYCKEQNVKYNGKIAIILESPHTEEFFEKELQVFGRDEGFLKARPANGQTGRLFEKYFSEILKKSEIFKKESGNLPPGDYSVSLINSIQNQCSLGANTYFYRDRVWARLWFCNDEYYKCNFIERVKKLDPTIIINCSTRGKHYPLDNKKTGYNTNKKRDFTMNFLKEECRIKQSKIDILNGLDVNIRNLISTEIKKNFTSAKIFYSNHPSSWYSEHNRILYDHI